MKRFAYMTMMVMSCIAMNGQKKYAISNSGCSVYMHCQPGFRTNVDMESNPVYTARCATKDDLSYGIICIKLNKEISNLRAAEDVMIQYMEFLKADFEIISVTGYQRGLKLQDRDDTRGVTDGWTDNKDNIWKVKGYTDGKFIGILYVFSKKNLPDEKVNSFLDGFRLPGME